jgi:hypothetical protein
MKTLPPAFFSSRMRATAASALSPPEQVRGCWINRDVGATTMRWLPDRARGRAGGRNLVYRQTGAPVSTRYTLEPSDQGHSLCELDASGAATQMLARGARRRRFA